MLEKGLVKADALNTIIDTYETKIGPRNGAHVVAKAWIDGDFKKALIEDAGAAVAALGYAGRQGEQLQAVENTPETHNLVVCTLCSCYPWTVLGLPPAWYKSAPYRSRAVSEPRSVMEEFGTELDSNIKIRVWDSTSELRYLVLPMQPMGTENWSEDKLSALVSRNSMIGVELARNPEDVN